MRKSEDALTRTRLNTSPVEGFLDLQTDGIGLPGGLQPATHIVCQRE